MFRVTFHLFRFWPLNFWYLWTISMCCNDSTCRLLCHYDDDDDDADDRPRRTSYWANFRWAVVVYANFSFFSICFWASCLRARPFHDFLHCCLALKIIKKKIFYLIKLSINFSTLIYSLSVILNSFVFFQLLRFGAYLLFQAFALLFVRLPHIQICTFRHFSCQIVVFSAKLIISVFN